MKRTLKIFRQEGVLVIKLCFLNFKSTAPWRWSGGSLSCGFLSLDGVLLGSSSKRQWREPAKWGEEMNLLLPFLLLSMSVPARQYPCPGLQLLLGLPNQLSCALSEVWTIAKHFPADMKKTEREYQKTEKMGKSLKNTTKKNWCKKNHKVWIILGASESGIPNFPYQKTPGQDDLTSKFHWTFEEITPALNKCFQRSRRGTNPHCVLRRKCNLHTKIWDGHSEKWRVKADLPHEYTIKKIPNKTLTNRVEIQLEQAEFSQGNKVGSTFKNQSR